MIIDEIAEEILSMFDLERITIIDYGIGPIYTYSIVKYGESVAMGVSYTNREEIKHAKYVEASRFNILELIKSYDILEKTVGVAIINALSQIMLPNNYLKGDILDYIDLEKDDKIVMIGYIRPTYQKIAEKGYNIKVIERQSIGDEVYSDIFTKRLLESATVCIITGASLVNDTIDMVLDYSKNCKVRALIGPTAQIHPEPLFKRGITHIGSIKIVDIEKAKDTILKGGGTRLLIKYSKKYTFKRN